MKIIKKISLLALSVLCVLLGMLFFQNSVLAYNTNHNTNFQEYIKQNLSYIIVDKNTIANKLYPINNNAKVYFFWNYSFFTITTTQELQQVKKQLKRDNLLAIFKDNKTLIVSEYLDPTISCLPLNAQEKKLFDAYPEKIQTTKNNLFLIGNAWTQWWACYIAGENVYLPSDDISKVDLQYLKTYAKNLTTIIENIIQGKDLKQIYTYIMRTTSYDYDALETTVESDYSPYLASSFFQGKKIVCDGYSKVFALLKNFSSIPLWAQRVTGSRQNIDKKDEKSFLHAWVKIWDKYYDPTFDDTGDENKYHYYAKPLVCFNLDHYTATIPWWRMFLNTQERFDFITDHLDTLLASCSNILSQTLMNDKKVEDFIIYLINNRTAKEIKKYFCDAFSICAVSWNTISKVKKELGQYTVHYADKKLILSEVFKTIESQDTKKDDVNASWDLSREIKDALDKWIKKLLAKGLFYSKTEREVYIRNIKKRIVILLSTDNLSPQSKKILLYISRNLKY